MSFLHCAHWKNISWSHQGGYRSRELHNISSMNVRSCSDEEWFVWPQERSVFWDELLVMRMNKNDGDDHSIGEPRDRSFQCSASGCKMDNLYSHTRIVGSNCWVHCKDWQWWTVDQPQSRWWHITCLTRCGLSVQYQRLHPKVACSPVTCLLKSPWPSSCRISCFGLHVCPKDFKGDKMHPKITNTKKTDKMQCTSAVTLLWWWSCFPFLSWWLEEECEDFLLFDLEANGDVCFSDTLTSSKERMLTASTMSFSAACKNKREQAWKKRCSFNGPTLGLNGDEPIFLCNATTNGIL